MDETVLWGIAFIVHIAIVVPKYLIATGEIDHTLKEGEAPFNRLMFSWTIGFVVLVVLSLLKMQAIPSFFMALVAFGGSFFALKMLKK